MFGMKRGKKAEESQEHARDADMSMPDVYPPEVRAGRVIMVDKFPPPPRDTELFRGASEVMLANALTKMQADIAGLRAGVDRQNRGAEMLNEAMGEFREKLIVPLREELKSLRYNMGAKVEQSTTELAVFVTHLDKALEGLLTAQGWSKERVAEFKYNHGLDSPQAPRVAEFNAYAETRERVIELERSNQELIAQNKRLLEQLRLSDRASTD